MKFPHDYVLVGEEITVHEENAEDVRNIFEYYLAGASIGEIVDMLFAKGISSPTGNSSGPGQTWISLWSTKNTLAEARRRNCGAPQPYHCQALQKK